MYHVFRCKPSGEGSWSLTRSFETDFMHHHIWCTVHQIPTRPKFYWTLDGSDQAVLAIDRFMITTPQSLTQSHSLGNSVDDFPSWIILAEKSSLNHNHSCTRFFQMQAIWWWSLDTVMQIPYLVIPIQIQTILEDKKTAKGLPKHNKIMNLRQCRTKCDASVGSLIWIPDDPDPWIQKNSQILENVVQVWTILQNIKNICRTKGIRVLQQTVGCWVDHTADIHMW